MPDIISRLLWGIFPPPEIRQFNLCCADVLEQSFFQPRLHASNPLISLKKSLQALLQNPEHIVEQIQQYQIPVEHYFLLCIDRIVRHYLEDELIGTDRVVSGNACRLYSEALISEQAAECLRLLHQIEQQMQLRGYSNERSMLSEHFLSASETEKTGKGDR